MQKALVIVGVGVIILAGGWWFLANRNTETARNTWQPPTSPPSTAGPSEPPPTSATLEQGASIGGENEAEFKCAGGKTITAVFTRDIAALTLSDGRQLTLRQAVSGSGIRYLNNTETIEFSGKGDDAFLTENGKTTYADCKAVD